MRLDKNPRFHLNYDSLAKTFKAGSEITLRAVMDAVMHIRRSKLPDPQEIGNAGSFFKNPEITQEKFNLLLNEYPDMPHYLLDSDKIKIPAGWLIEQCGWKGKRSGNIGVYSKQALVIVNYGGATGLEIKHFSEQIQASVYEKFSINLTTEVNII